MARVKKFFGIYVMEVRPRVWMTVPVNVPSAELKDDEELIIFNKEVGDLDTVNFVKYFDDFPVVVSLTNSVDATGYFGNARVLFDSLSKIAEGVHEFARRRGVTSAEAVVFIVPKMKILVF